MHTALQVNEGKVKSLLYHIILRPAQLFAQVLELCGDFNSSSFACKFIAVQLFTKNQEISQPTNTVIPNYIQIFAYY